MKRLMLALLLAPSIAAANPYFRGFDYHHAVYNIGACTDPQNVGHSEICTVAGIINHHKEDGYLLIPGEDWTLLAVGWAGSGEGHKLVLGPAWNILPILTAFGSAAKEAPVAGLKFDGSFGPMWEFDPFYGSRKGRFGHGYFRLFAGESLKW